MQTILIRLLLLRLAGLVLVSPCEDFPILKLQNLQRLKESHPDKHEKQYQDLKKKIDTI
jgi:hypothetical protein